MNVVYPIDLDSYGLAKTPKLCFKRRKVFDRVGSCSTDFSQKYGVEVDQCGHLLGQVLRPIDE